MTHKMTTALTVKEAKKLDYTFDINAQKSEVATDWVTEYGYNTALLLTATENGGITNSSDWRGFMRKV